MPFLASRIFGWHSVEITEDWQLRDVPLGQALPLCNTVFCSDCHLVFLDIRFDEEEMMLLYDDYRGAQYVTDRDSYEPGYSDRNTGLQVGIQYKQDIEAMIGTHLGKAAQVLDWGGDTGKNTPYLETASLVHIFDISNVSTVPPAKRVTAEETLNVAYDLVVVSNVLEHVSYPRLVLEDVMKRMGKNTLLYVEVPQELLVRNKLNSPSGFSDKRHWHEHVNFFNPLALSRMAEGLQLSILATEVLEVTVAGKQGSNFGVLLRKHLN